MTQTWSQITETAQVFRRTLHQSPELSWQEFNTAKAIRSALTELDIPWRACAKLGTVATVGDALPGKSIALRADMDALPIQEATEVDWKSKTDGCMHACGHDGHTATLFASAMWLKAHENELKRPITLIFQPAEEGGHGAKRMIDDGALENVAEIYGWHNWPAIPFGKAVCPEGPIMAGNGTFRITLTGKGGHASQPDLCRDPVLAASAVTMSLQQVVSRQISPQSPVVLSVTSIDARSGDTVIPETATIGGSIRIGSANDRAQLNEAIKNISTQTARAYGVEAVVEIFDRYQATINHFEQSSIARAALKDSLGNDWLSSATPTPIMASEDFSYYLNEIPGAFALIGSDDGNGHDKPCHSPHYDFNDRLIPLVTRFYARLAGAPLPVGPPE